MEPHSLLQRLRRHHGEHAPLWLFGYASLIWRPEIEYVEHAPATVHGWHRALRMRSVEHRGSPERPGLVFALMAGGSCRGMAYRLPPGDPLPLLQKLWVREMPNRVYEPRWLPARTPHGVVPALAFTLARHSPACTGRMDDAHVVEVFRHARGGFGRTIDYVVQTAGALRAHGIVDSEVERLVRLAHRHGLVDGGDAAA